MAIAWCVSTLGAPKWGLDEFLDLAKEYSLSALELRFLNNSLDIAAEMNAYLSEPQRAAKLARSGVALPVVGSSLEIGKAGDSEFENFTSSARIADQIGAKWLRVFDGPVWGESIGDAEEKNGRKIIAKWREWIRQNNIQARMALETHGASSSTKVFADFVDALGEPLDVIWDIHHTHLVAGESFQETWDRLGDRIVHVHIKDSLGIPSARHEYTLTLPGQGRLDGREVMSFLQEKGYNGYVSLEWEKKWHPYLPPLKDAVAALQSAGWRTA